MKDEKNFEEIEIEQIDLDIDQDYDISIDVSSIGGLEFEEKEGSELKLGEMSVKEEVEPNFLESSQEVSLGSEVESKEVVQSDEEREDIDMISISTEELDSILGGASVKEEEEEGVSIETLVAPEDVEKGLEISLDQDILSEGLEMPSIESEEIASTSEIGDIFSELESKEISIGEEEKPEEMILSVGEAGFEGTFSSKGIEEGVVEKGEVAEEKKPEIVVISTEEYNKMVEESKTIPIIEKPLEETFEVEEETEEFETKEKISPEEIGIGSELQDFELKEFEEISEDMVVAKALEEETVEPMEVVETGFEGIDLLSEGIESISIKPEEEMEKATTLGGGEKFELVDDISVEVDVSPQSQVSIMPDEVGLEEISIEPVEVTPKEEITGISFADTEIAVESLEMKEEEPIIGGFEEVVPMETVAREDKAYKVEKAIEELTDEEKEEIKKVLLYLDKLLENLPEEKIKEFAQSEYYDIYVRLFDKLNLR